MFKIEYLESVGKPDYEKIKTIDLENLIKEKDIRLQKLLFETAHNVYNQINMEGLF